MSFVINFPCSERVSILTSSNFGSVGASSPKSVEASISNQRRHGGDTTEITYQIYYFLTRLCWTNGMAEKSMHNYIFAGVRCKSLKETIRMFPVKKRKKSVEYNNNKLIRYRVCQIRRGIIALISHFRTGVDIES